MLQEKKNLKKNPKKRMNEKISTTPPFPCVSKFWLVCLANLIYGEGLGVGMEGRSWRELRCL